MFKNYLPKRVHGIFLISIIVLIFFTGFKNGFFLFLLYFLALFLFRKNTNSLHREINSSKGLIFSPVFGVLSGIKKNVSHKIFGHNLTELRFYIPFGSEMGLYLPAQGIKKNVSHKIFGHNLTELRFYIPFGSEMGLYLPAQGEIKNIIIKWGTVINRSDEIPNQENETLNVPLLEIKNKNNEIIGMQFLECSFGLFPHFYILPGDRGMALANFGYFPFGGTVLLYLPGNYEILIKENTKVSPKDVLIANLKA